jgi:hypothetical protein
MNKKILFLIPLIILLSGCNYCIRSSEISWNIDKLNPFGLEFKEGGCNFEMIPDKSDLINYTGINNITKTLNITTNIYNQTINNSLNETMLINI